MTVHDGRDKFGRYYEEFEPGDVYKHWPSKTITEAEDHLFCDITMNHHPLHSDRWYAEEETHFKQNVVVGNFVYSLVLGMSVPDVSGKAIANLEVEVLKQYPGPDRQCLEEGPKQRLSTQEIQLHSRTYLRHSIR